MDNKELFNAWTAGFWEGEGSVYKKQNGSGNGFVISITQCLNEKRKVKEIMFKLKNIYGGNITTSIPKNPYHHTKLEWRISKGKDIVAFIKHIQPYCQFRQIELQNVLNIYEQHPEYFTKFKTINIDKAKELREKGLTYAAIGKILNEYPTTIFRRLNYHCVS